MKREINIWGSIPPPYGGVGMHILRLLNGLKKKKANVVLKNYMPQDDLKIDYCFVVRELLKLPFIKTKILHFHMSSTLLCIVLLTFGFRHKIGITIHNQRSILIKNRIIKYIFSKFYQRCDFIIMNDEVYSKKFAHYFNISEIKKICIVPAFIPPTDEERTGVDDSVKSFRDSFDFIISSCSYGLTRENGHDVYGVDMLIELVYRLKLRNIDAGLLLCLSHIVDQNYYEQLKNRIKEYGIDRNVFILNKEVPNGFEYWEISDVFIRATKTDMEGISVKEALSLGTSVIASNVCKRPSQCILYRDGDIDDLYEKVHTLFLSGKYKEKINYENPQDVVETIYNIYKEL